MIRSCIATLCTLVALLISSPLLAATTALSFDAPVPGTITDTNGQGTGFTNRLPGTGSAHPANDPNLDLVTNPGKLLISSTQADINQTQPGLTGLNLPNLETLGIFVAGVGAGDLSVRAVFENVNLPSLSDQITLFAGANENLILRAGLHEGNVYIFSPNMGNGDMNSFTGQNAFATGDTLELTLARQSSLWSLTWNNLTANTSGGLTGFSLPWLDSQSDFYFGVLAANARSSNTFVATLDSFSVTVVPEPSTVVLFGLSTVALILVVRRRHRPA